MAPAAYRTLLEHELRRTDARSIISITSLLISDGLARHASDIHIDLARDRTSIRFRVHGRLSEAYSLPTDRHPGLIARLKILSRLRTDEHFSPQDGGFRFASPEPGAEIDIRLSIVPAQFGESAVLRLLVPRTAESFIQLGMIAEQEKEVEKALSWPHGLILIVGPTGSGKTTTLYAMTQRLAKAPRSIVSIEDPIEYSIPNVRQIQTMPRQGLTFAEGLRTILRQDPDVIVIGEIRDVETAQIAVNAAFTGHLVLSTLHAINTAGAIARLEELGISTLRLSSIRPFVIAQKLVPSSSGRCGEFELQHG